MFKIKPFNQRHTPAPVLDHEFSTAEPGKPFAIPRYTWNDHTGLPPKQYIRLHYGDEYELKDETPDHYLFFRNVLPTINIRFKPDDFVFVRSQRDIMKFRVDRVDRNSKKVVLVNDFNPLERINYMSTVHPPVFNDGEVLKMKAKYRNQVWYIYRFTQQFEKDYQMYLLEHQWQAVYKQFMKEVEKAEKMLTDRRRFAKCFQVLELFKEFEHRMYSIRKTAPNQEFVENGRREIKQAARHPKQEVEANQMGGDDLR